MDAILAAATSLTGTNCSYNGSVRTIDVTNSTAVAFTKAFLQKYIDYFAGKGCQYFNMGADEYANDKYSDGSMGFGNLQSTGKYSYYVEYVNAVAGLIKAAKMTPMAFNDGIYFNNNTSSGTFDTDIVICYWSSGWSSYTPMSAFNLAGKGFKMVNTHGDYYWVLGKSDAQCDVAKAKGFNNNTFPGSTINNSTGSMFCVWCDYPGAETEQEIAQKIRLPLRAMAQRMKGESVVLDENELVSGGFKADGTINTDVDFAVDTATGIKVSASGVKTVDVTAKTDNLPEVTGAVEVLAWEVTPAMLTAMPTRARERSRCAFRKRGPAQRSMARSSMKTARSPRARTSRSMRRTIPSPLPSRISPRFSRSRNMLHRRST